MPPIRARGGCRPRVPEPSRVADRVLRWRSLHLLPQLQQISVELIEAAFPERALLRHPALRRAQRLRHQAIRAHSPYLARAGQAALFENVEMLRERGERHVEAARQL